MSEKNSDVVETLKISSPTPAPRTIADVPTNGHAFLKHMLSRVTPTSFAELQLLVLTFTTGMQDATTFPDYHCFASNQTGNSVLLALSLTSLFTTPNPVNGVASGELFVTANIGISLGFFLLGASVTGQLGHHLFHPLSRPWLILSNFLQTIMVFVASVLQYKHGIQLEGTTTLIILALLAFESGSQVVASRSLRMTEISTAMATAAWVDLLVDPAIFRRNNHSRDRRVLFLITLVLGSFFGAVAYAKVGSAFAILISGVGKLVVTLSFCFNPVQRPLQITRDLA